MQRHLIKIVPLLLIAILYLYLNNAEQTKANDGSPLFLITKVVDGDTFWILNEKNEKEKIRLIGVNAPESRKTGRKDVECFGKEASDYAKKLLLNQRVRLEYDVQRTDKYGRTLAYVYLEDGTFVNDLLVKKGYAHVATYPPNVKYVDIFRNSEKYARKKELGLWNKNNCN